MKLKKKIIIYNITDEIIIVYNGRGRNEIFSRCFIDHCEDSCLHPTKSLGCTGECKRGCICSEGHIRNSKKECVLPKDCGKWFFNLI